VHQFIPSFHFIVLASVLHEILWPILIPIPFTSIVIIESYLDLWLIFTGVIFDFQVFQSLIDAHYLKHRFGLHYHSLFIEFLIFAFITHPW